MLTHWPLVTSSLCCIIALVVGTAVCVRGTEVRHVVEDTSGDSQCRALAVHNIAKCACCDEKGCTISLGSPSSIQGSRLGTPLDTPSGSSTSSQSLPQLQRGAMKQVTIFVTFIFFCKAAHYTLDKMLCGVISHGICAVKYSVFLLVATAARDVLKVVGFMLDSGKTGSRLCGYWVAEINASLFYCFFYRGMFDHVREWNTFVLLHGTHLLLEWVAHPFRATDWYFDKVQALARRSPPWLAWMLTAGLLTAQPTLTSDGWACFIGLDFAIRSYALIYSVVVYYGGVAWLHFGWNKGSMYHLPGSESESGFHMLMTQSIAFVVTEVINCVLMEIWFRRRLGRPGALRRLAGLLKDDFMLMFFTLCLAGHACTNIWPDFFAESFCSSSSAEHSSQSS